MKVRALRDKDTKEFITIMKLSSGGKYLVFTSDTPTILGPNATMEVLKEVYPLEESDFDNYDNFEIVEYDLIEAGEVGADIRNKLSPPKNLVALLEEFFSSNEEEDDVVLRDLIKKEMKQTKVSLKYLAKLL